MKKLFFSAFLLSAAVSAAPFHSPDIMIVSKLNADWSTVLVRKVKNLLSNFGIQDPFKNSYSGSLVVNQSTIGAILPASSRNLTRDFGVVLGLDVLQAKTEVSLHGFSYEVKDFKIDVKKAQQTGDGLDLETTFAASELNIQAGKITLALVIPTRNGTTAPVVNIDIIKPVLTAKDDRIINFLAKFKIQEHADYLNFKIKEVNFDQMISEIAATHPKMNLDYERIDIPKVSVRIGTKQVNFSPEKIRAYLRKNHQALEGFLLVQMAQKLKQKTSDAVFKLVESYKVNKKYWLPTPKVKAQLGIDHITSFPGRNEIVAELLGDFCTVANFELYKEECLKKKVTQVAKSRLTSELHQQSVTVIQNLMDAGPSLIMSISEDYLNNLIATTIDAEMWKEALSDAEIELGPKKVSLRLDEKGRTGTLLLDGIYYTKRLERIATGASMIRFPLSLKASFRIEMKDGVPVLIIRANEVDLSDDTLVYGLPEYGLESSVQYVRFQGKVLQAMRKAMANLKGVDMITLPVDEIRGMSLEAAVFHSDGFGRVFGIMKMEDVSEKKPEAILDYVLQRTLPL
jgi:hypothetical protein